MTTPSENQSPDQPATTSALMWFGVLAWVIALFLISQLGSQTAWVDGQPLSRQPALSSIVSLYGLAFFGLCWLAFNWRAQPGWWRSNPFREVAAWVASLEYIGWFMCYVWLVPVTGYLFTTLAFCMLLAARCGYRSKRSQLAAAFIALCIVLLFKTFLAVKLPAAQIYEWLPAGLRNFMIIYF